MASETLEHKVIGPANWLELVSQLEVLDGVPQMDTVSVIQTARKNGEKISDGTPLTKLRFYAGNGCAYGLKRSDVWLYLTNPPNNPGLKNPEEFALQLNEQDNYFLNLDESNDLRARAKASDGSVLAINLSQLKREGMLEIYDDEFSDIKVNSDIKVKTKTLKAGRDAVQGQYEEIVTSLIDIHGDAIYGKYGIGASLLAEEKIETGISVLTPQYVVNKLKGRKKGTMLARASRLYSFGSHSDVALNVRYLDLRRYARGVVKSAAEGGDVQKIMSYESALDEANRLAPRGTPFNLIICSLVNRIYGR